MILDCPYFFINFKKQNMKTLEEQFGRLSNKKFPKESDGLKECHALNTRTILLIIKHIVENNCILEHRGNIDSDDWKRGTLREFLKYAVQNHDDKDNPTCDSWTLNFWRIKTQPTEEEIYQLTQAGKNED